MSEAVRYTLLASVSVVRSLSIVYPNDASSSVMNCRKLYAGTVCRIGIESAVPALFCAGENDLAPWMVQTRGHIRGLSASALSETIVRGFHVEAH